MREETLTSIYTLINFTIARRLFGLCSDIYSYAEMIRSGKTEWKDLDDKDIDSRLKFAGLLHRRKRAPGTFMMRLKVPNGIVTSDQMRFYAKSVEKYKQGDVLGDALGVVDITTRQNIQVSY